MISPLRRSLSNRPATFWHPAWLLAGIVAVNSSWSFLTWRYWYQVNGIEISTSRLALLAAIDWGFWIVGAPLVWWLAKRMPPVTLRAFGLVHLPLSLVTACAAIALSQLVRSALEPRAGDYWSALQARIAPELGWYVILYWLVVCSYLALSYYAAYQSKITETLELKLNNAVLDRDLAESRLANLRHQLHPHFLFNALHTVSALMEFSVDDAREKLVKLSNLLRLSLAISQRSDHPAVDEAAWLSDYLTLEAIRHRPAVDWRLDLAPDVRTALLPCLLTQPLVENAIKHAMRKPDAGGLKVHIAIAPAEGALQICVDDNGKGWPDGAIDEGIGLKYVRRAVSQLGFASARLCFEASPMGGARARLLLPLTFVPEPVRAA